MGWHLLHIARGKPQYEFLADKPKTVLSFMALAATLTLSRHAFSLPDFSLTWGQALIGMLSYWVVLAVITMRRRRSDSLFCAFLGVSCVIDIVQGLLYLVLDHGFPHISVIAIELLLMTLCWLHFTRMPLDVQATGYGRNR